MITSMSAPHKTVASQELHAEDFRAVITLSPDLAEAMLSAAPGELVRMPVMRLGKYVWAGVKLAIDPEMTSEIVHNFEARPVDVPLSYEHTIEHPQRAMGQPIPAAGWLKRLETEPDASGILWGWFELTAEARTLIKSGSYRYLSPAYTTHYPNHKTGKDQGATLTSVALTNKPFLDMPPIEFTVVLPAAAETDYRTPAEAGTKEKTMKMKKVKLSAITDGEQKGHLKVEHSDFPPKDADGGDQGYYADSGDVKAAMSDVPEMTAAVQGVIALSGVPGATELSTSVFQALAAKVGHANRTARVITLAEVPGKDGKRDYYGLSVPDGAVVDAGVFRQMQADHLLDTAIAQGKILPAQRELYGAVALSTPDVFRALVEALPATVRLGVNGTGAPGGGGVELSAEEAAVANQMGLDHAKVLEAKKDIARQ